MSARTMISRGGCRSGEVLYPWCRNERGQLTYRVWMIKPVMGLDPDECDHEQNWWDWEEGEDHERRLG